MRLRALPLFLPVLALLLPALATAATPDPAVTALRRVATLQRGINLSNWFASGDLSAAHIAKHTTPADLKLIHDLGFTYVRLGVDPTQFGTGNLTAYDAAQAVGRLDHAIDQVLAANLAVSLCIFPNDDYKRQLTGQGGVDRFIFLWRALAQHYAATDPDRVFFELINEPEINDPYRWDGIQAATVDAIRRVDPNHTIVATASFYSGLQELLHTEPMRDANVIYNFHFYEPMPFTHQGASWGSFEWNFYKNVPYPATPETLSAALASVPDDNARYVLYLYGVSGWNKATMLGRLNFARAWADEKHVPVICNEFGAFRDTVPADSRTRYLHDVRTNLEQLHIGWAMWDYSGNFGLVTRSADGRAVPDPAVVEALGLK